MPLISTHGACTMYQITLKRKQCLKMWYRGNHIFYSLSLIGLSLGKNYKYGTMALIIPLMMRLLSGLKVRKPKG